MKNSLIHAAKSALFLLLVTGLFAACSNSTGSDHDDEQEPIGFKIKQNGLVVIAEPTTSSKTDSLTVSEGSTTTFTVVFIDEDGDEFTPDPDEHSITLETQSSIISFININSDVAPFSFDVVAQSVGTGTFDLKMLHEGAAEFTRPGLPFEVTSSN